MNKERKKRFQDVIALLEEAKDELVDIQSEEIDAFDSLPEGLQISDRGDKMQECIDFIDDAMGKIDNVICYIEKEVK